MNENEKVIEGLLEAIGEGRPDALGAEQLVDIMTEITHGYDRLSGLQPAVSFFGSARIQPGEPAWESARETARLLSESGFAIISGGGPGIMEAVNRGARQGGSPSVGLNIRLPGRTEPPNQYQDISLHFHHFFVRKSIFVHFAAAFVVMPGGFGTLDEVLECLTLMQTDKARRIPVILMDSGFWTGLTDWFRNTLLRRGTIAERDLEAFQIIDQPEKVRDAVVEYYTGRAAGCPADTGGIVGSI